MSNLLTDPIDSPEKSPPSKQDEIPPQVQNNESTNKMISSDYEDTLLNESPPSEGKDTESSSLGDDFEKIEEGDYIINDDHHKDTNIAEEFDIIGMEDDGQHFEVLDSAIGDNDHHNPSSTTATAGLTTQDTSSSSNMDNSHIEETNDVDGEEKRGEVHVAAGSEDQDEIDITTTDDIRDKDQDGRTSSSRDKKSKSISPIRFEKHSETASSNKKSDSSSKGDSGAHRITDKLFHNTRYFVMKSNNFENVDIAKTRNVWSTLPYNEKKLNKAYRDCKNVLLIYSVKESGCFQGFAKLVSESRTDTQRVPWVLPPTISASQLNSVFKLDWIHRGNLDFNSTMDLKNPWNENKPVKISRDGQEIEPTVGEKLCKLWRDITSEDDSSVPRDKRKGIINLSRKDGGSGGIPPYPHHMTPMLHYPPPIPIYHDGRHGPPQQIHLNPLYPPPSKHHLTEAEELLSSKRRKTDRGSSSHSSKSDRVIRHHSRSPSRDYGSSSSRRYKGGESSSSRRRRSKSRSRSRSRSRERSSKYKDHRERSSRDKSKKSSSSGHGGSSSGSGGTFEKNFGVSKETLLHGSYADYIKEYTARSSRTAGQQPMNISQIASQYQKALSQVASALASQTATQQQQPLDPQTYNKKVEEFLERTKQKS